MLFLLQLARWKRGESIVTNIKSPLWDAVLIAACTLLMAYVPWYDIPVIVSDPLFFALPFAVFPSLVAGFVMWRVGATEDAYVNILIASGIVAAAGFCFSLAGGINSFLFHPEETLCSTYGCTWNPGGFNSNLVGGGLSVAAFAMFEGFLAVVVVLACATIKRKARI